MIKVGNIWRIRDYSWLFDIYSVIILDYSNSQIG